MPSSTIHHCVGLKMYDYINIDDKDKKIYEIGSIAPDSWRNTKRFKESELPKMLKRRYSHFSNDNTYEENYDIFVNKYRDRLDNPFYFGYLVHLITDYWWRKNMFYRCFDRFGDIIMKDGTLFNGEKGVRHKLLSDESKKICTELSKIFNMVELDTATDDEINSIPTMEELDFDGINDTIRFSNKEAFDDFDYEKKVYTTSNFVNGINECALFVLEELDRYGIKYNKKNEN